MMIKNYPLVCVCIPVYNGERTIGRTLQSIIKQDYTNFEVLVCDNMSTDNTLEIIESVVKNTDIKITIITNSTNGCAEANWNYILDNVKSEAAYIALFHADDMYMPNCLTEQLNFITKNDLGASFTYAKLIDENDKDISKQKKYKPELPFNTDNYIFTFENLFPKVLRYRNFMITPSCIFKKEIIRSLQPVFDFKSSISSSDLDTWLRISKMNKIGILPKTLIKYRISTLQGSYIFKQGRTEPADFFKVMDRHLLSVNDKTVLRKELMYYQIMKSIDSMMCATNFLKQRNAAEAKKHFRTSLYQSNILIFTSIKYLKDFLFSFAIFLLLKLGFLSFCYKIAGKIKTL